MTENLISKPINVRTDTSGSVECIGSINFPAYTLPKYCISQYIYTTVVLNQIQTEYTLELNMCTLLSSAY